MHATEFVRSSDDCVGDESTHENRTAPTPVGAELSDRRRARNVRGKKASLLAMAVRFSHQSVVVHTVEGSPAVDSMHRKTFST